MTGISSGIGLISGIQTAELIDQLIAIDRQPIDNLQTRVDAIGAQRAAFLELSAQLLAVQNSVSALGRSSFFDQFLATSTNEDVLTATAGAGAAPGNFTFRVRSLATTHAVISRGFADADRTSVGVGTLAIEVGQGRVNQPTPLGVLNDGHGVPRGVITITDRSGASADIDLTTAMTVDDVLEAINSAGGISVRAGVTGLAFHGHTGDRIVVEDLSGGTGNLSVADKSGGTTAAALGLVGSTAGARLDGVDLIRLTMDTPLAMLNDGNDISRRRASDDLVFSTTNGDFTVSLTDILATQLDTDVRLLNGGNGVRLGVIRITDRTGLSSEVDLTSAQTVQDVLDAINGAGLAIKATVIDSYVQIADTSTLDDDVKLALKIEDVSGQSAADLGIDQEVESDTVRGSDVYRVATVGDLIRAINFASGNQGALVEASLSADGHGISLRAMGIGNTVTVKAGLGSGAAADLGLLDATFSGAFESRRLLSGLNTVLLSSLNGGRGVSPGSVRLTDRAGATSTIDVSEAQTLQDVIDLINADAGIQLAASINTSGNGIMLRDESGGNVGAMIVEDVSGSLAANLGIAVAASSSDPFSGTFIDGGSAQLQYVSERTLLSELNGGRGVAPGTFQITDSSGATYSVALSDDAATVGAVLEQINAVNPGTIEARINDTGDGIVVIDKSGGTLSMKIEDRNGGRAAADLRLAGTAEANEDRIDGSFEIQVEIDADDTLNDVVQKINDAGLGISASVLTHGGAFNTVSLSITSGLSGRRGELLIDSSDLDLGFSTLSRAQDAVIAMGDDASTAPVLVSSSSNSMDDVIQGMTLNLLSASDKPVTVSVAQDVDGVVASVKGFVDGFNKVLDTIDEDTDFDAETMERGLLLGDGTVSIIRTRLTSLALKRFEGVDESMSRLFSVGIRGGEGGRLKFDEDKFREVLSESPSRVEALFTNPETGVAAVLKETLEELTRSFDGVIARKDDLLTDQQELLNDRMDRMNVLLNAKRARLEAQFVALESTLAALQQQQDSLAALAGMTV